MEEISKKLREYRAGLNATQREMAEKIGISSASLSAYESGSKTPPLDIAIRIADTLNVSLDYLCGRITRKAESRINTYADIIKRFIELTDVLGGHAKIEYTERVGSSCGDMLSDEELLRCRTINKNGYPVWGKMGHARFLSIDGILASFFKGWSNVRKLYLDGTIDDEMYRAWLDKKLGETEDTQIGSRLTLYGQMCSDDEESNGT